MRRKVVAGVLAVGVVGLVGAVATVAVAPPFVQELLYDSRASGVPCAELPTLVEVRTALEEHDELVRAVEAVGDEVSVVASTPCASHPDRSEVVVFYPGGDDRRRITDLLAHDALGVPVSLRNT